MVSVFTHYPYNAAVYDEHNTGSARRHPTVQSRTINGNSSLRSLAYGVLFCMDGANAMLCYFPIFMKHFFHMMSDIIAVREPGGRTYIPCHENLIIFLNHTAASPHLLCRPLLEK